MSSQNLNLNLQNVQIIIVDETDFFFQNLPDEEKRWIVQFLQNFGDGV